VIDAGLAADAIADGVNPLTERERDVLAAARRYATAAEIAAQLYLSEGTVRNYLSAAIRKLGARCRLRRPADTGTDLMGPVRTGSMLWPVLRYQQVP
jgi:FixJ family two-component response regulator